MPRPERRKMRRRTGQEKEIVDFSINIETTRQAIRRGKMASAKGDLFGVYPKAFGTGKKIEGAQHIGAIEQGQETTHWHVDRRKQNRRKN
jgi:hypothetical protein